MVGVLFLVSCSGDDGDAVPTTESSPAEVIEPAPGDAEAPLADGELPRLQDVVVPEWEPETRTEQLLSEIGLAELTPQQAVDVFALLHAEMPDATPSDLPVGQGLDASYAWMLIRSVMEELTPEQRALVEELDAGESIGHIDADGTITEFGLASDETTTQGLHGFAPAQPTAVWRRYLRLAQTVMADWRRHRPDLPTFAIFLDRGPKLLTGGGMETGPDGDDPPGTCTTSIDPGFVAANNSDALIKFFFAHEFFHCIQFQWNPGMNWKIAPWVFDGSADFAAGDLYRGIYSPTKANLWAQWFTKQSAPLAARWYDAWPLFETFQQEGDDPYPSIEVMVRAVTSAAAAPALAIGVMDGLLFRMKWSSRSMRSRTHPSNNWQLPWPGPNPGAGPRDNQTAGGSRGIGTYTVRGHGGFAHPQIILKMTSDVGILTVSPSVAPLTTEVGEGLVHIAEGSKEKFCFDPSRCRCPEGQTSESTAMSGREVIVSFAASSVRPLAAFTAEKWNPDKMCKKDKRSKRGSSNGDPHLVSFDGQPFDVMTLGEFVTSRDPAGDFEIQTRHLPISAVAAGTSAVAIGTGDHRITFTVPQVDFLAEPVIRVDGEDTADSTIALGDVNLSLTGPDAVVTWPDGSTVEVTFAGGWFVTISPTPERAAVLEGLLGSADSDFTNDLRMPDGTIVDPVRASAVDSEFSVSWRVDESTSLFDYERGESPRTFNVPTPKAPPVVIAEEALATCADALGSDAVSHEVSSCAYDVMVTGDEGYVDAYVEVVEGRVVADEDFDVGDEKPSPAPTGSVAKPVATGTATLTLSGTLVSSTSTNVAGDEVVFRLAGSLTAAEGTVMVLRAESCEPGVTLFAWVTERTSGAAGSFFVCDAGGRQLAMSDEDDDAVMGEVYFWLPFGGEHEVVIESDSENPAFVSVDVFVDAEPTIVDADEVADGGHTATLDGVGDTVVYVSSPDFAGATFTTSGLDVACATEAYGASVLGTEEVWSLAGFCEHGESISIPGYEVPLVVFARTADPVEFKLTP